MSVLFFMITSLFAAADLDFGVYSRTFSDEEISRHPRVSMRKVEARLSQKGLALRVTYPNSKSYQTSFECDDSLKDIIFCKNETGEIVLRELSGQMLMTIQKNYRIVDSEGNFKVMGLVPSDRDLLLFQQ